VTRGSRHAPSPKKMKRERIEEKQERSGKETKEKENKMKKGRDLFSM